MEMQMTRHFFKHSLLPIASAFLLAGAAIGTVGAQDPQPKYQRDIPARLAKRAKVTEAEAAKTASAAVPNAQISSVELEDEGGKLLYSYDMKIPGKTGIEEVHVDAKSGKLLTKEHETPAAERTEAAQDAAAAKHAKKQP